MDVSVNGILAGAAKVLGIKIAATKRAMEANVARQMFRGRAESTYRGARRNAWRRDGRIGEWRDAPYNVLKRGERQYESDIVVRNPTTGMRETHRFKRTVSVVQVLHASLAKI